jgi:phage baseplate assembly protein gpV
MSGDDSLRLGEIERIDYPTDSTNESKTQNEYLVRATHRDRRGIECSTLYRCVLADWFGGQADYMRYSLRAQVIPPTTQEVVGDGSMVLFACVNGETHRGVIISGVRHPAVTTADPAKKRFLSFEFNGVHVDIDDNGTLVLKVPGATNLDGSPDSKRKATNKGSTVTLDASGDIKVDDQNGDSILISPASNSIVVTAKNVTVKATSVLVEAGKVQLGADNLQPMQGGVVLASGIDTFTGTPYGALGNASQTVMANK